MTIIFLLAERLSLIPIVFVTASVVCRAAEVEHFLGDPDVLHAMALVLGIILRWLCN